MAETVAELTVDLGAIGENYRHLARLSEGARVVPAVKADAYGLGTAAVVPALAAAGATAFLVAHAEEGLAVLRLLPRATVFVLHGVMAGEAAELAAVGLVPVLNDLGQAELWRAEAARQGRVLPAALHLDSGMTRLGLSAGEAARLAETPAGLEGIALQMVMSHLACSDEPEHALNEAQRRQFLAMAERLPPAPRSLAASSGIFLGSAYRFDLVRPGYALYGGNPTPGRDNPMRPVVSLRARILQVRHVDSPMTVGYGATHRVGGPSRLATLGVGYGDGLSRALSNRGHVRIDGVRAPIIGRVSMDLTVVDVTALPEATVHPGRFVELLDSEQGVDVLAADAGTIGYEVLTALSQRYRRRYLER